MIAFIGKYIYYIIAGVTKRVSQNETFHCVASLPNQVRKGSRNKFRRRLGKD